jgi:hypothetical protein
MKEIVKRGKRNRVVSGRQAALWTSSLHAMAEYVGGSIENHDVSSFNTAQ